MSLYKDASLVMLPTAYKDGKLYSVRPTDGSGDFTFSRGSNLAATRVASSGYIEKGRENVLLNSVWDGIGTNVPPTSWTNGFTSGNYESASSSFSGNNGIHFYGTSARRYISQIPSFSGIMALSVYVESVTTADEIRYVLNQIGGTELFYLEDSSVVANTTSILAGKTYTLVFNTSGTTEIRIGGGVTGSRTYDFTLSVPQLEQGLVRTDYIETTTTSVSAGILEDMPRLDYSGGASCPSLLLEPQRTNQIIQSEYFGASTWLKRTSDATPVPVVTDNYAVSPEGVQNAARVVITKPSGDSQYAVINENKVITKSAGDKFSASVYLKATDASQVGKIVDLYAYDGSYMTMVNHTLTADWERVEAIHTATTGTSNVEMVTIGKARASAGGTGLSDMATDFLVYGAEFEAGSYPTSYIPTYGASVTRSVDQLETSPYDYQSQGVLGANVGTIILDCETIGTSTGSNDFHMFGGAQSIADGYLFRANTGTTIDILERVSNGTSAQWTSIATKQTRNKIGVSYSGADVDVYVNGVAKSVSSGTPVGGGNINGFSNSGSNAAGLIIHQILLFPNKLTDSEMASITTL